MTERHDKKAQFEQGRKRSRLPWVVAALVALTAAGLVGWKFTDGGGRYPLVSASGGQVSIPLEEVSDGRAHFFSYAGGETRVDFFLLQSGDGTIRAALDTCDVCYRERKGYRQEGEYMVCNNCNQKFRSDMINVVKGGCNPAPLERTVEGGKVVIAAAELDRGVRYFAAGK